MSAPVKVRAARAVAVGLALMALFVFFFVFPTHEPAPNGVPVAVAEGVDLPIPGLETRAVSGEDQARELILDREVYGAVLADKVLVSSASSFVVAQLLATAAGAQEVEDVAPLDEDDPRGLAINQMLLPLLITGILSVMVLNIFAPDLRSGQRFAAHAVLAGLGGLVVMAIAKLGIGVLPGSYLALSAIAALILLAIGLPAGALIRLVGQPGVGLSFILFLMLGVPGSGAAGAPELLPEPWQTGGQFLQAGSGAEAIRNVAYFDGAALTVPLAVLFGWAVIGAAGHLLANRRPPASMVGTHT